MAIRTLHDLFVHGLMDMHHAERQLSGALPRLCRAASNASLRQAFARHGVETESQIARLEIAFASLEQAPRGVRCTAVAQLLHDGEQMVEDLEHGPIRDACLITAAQKIEHYEIGSYSALHAMAHRLGLADSAEVIGSILNEERRTAERLDEIAATIPVTDSATPVIH
jgi:ferritin-like metal-binding protein YciE